MESNNQKIKWWNWLFGLMPVLAYIIISMVVANAIRENAQTGGWSVILYALVPQLALLGIIVNGIRLGATKHALNKEKWIIRGLIAIDIIMIVLCVMVFMGHPEVALFWWYWFN